MLEKFNGKYADLNLNQKSVLREFITSVDSTPKLKTFYNTKISEIKSSLSLLTKQIENKATRIKLQEINNIINPLGKTSSIGNDDLVNLLQYYELLEELTNIHG
jgi:hypothetical protein